ncbi:hypothetical protein FRB90_002373 [Tulasnella sp. 427]|nr:hypothetical protein FRB90_002373 [Tulasnella sp. 427]
MSRQAMPRSILKCSTPVASAGPAHHHHHPHSSVRFPSSPKLSTVHFTHCPTSYDRTPIVVSQNSCAMPERGCRNYATEGQQQQFAWGRSFHPSAFNAYRPMGTSDELFMDPGLLPPGLSSDDGSSEESDGIASPPPEAIQASSDGSHYRAYVPSQSHLHTDPLSHPPIPHPSIDAYDTTSSSNSSNATDYSLSFLPHPPAISTCSSKKSRDKSKQHHHREPRSAATASSFSSSWGQSDESSCLGGF